MFLKAHLSWKVVICAENVDSEGLKLQKAILLRLIDDFLTKKASKNHGYFVSLTTLDRIGEALVSHGTGELVFPVDFSCVTFKMLVGEVLEGVVHQIMKHGVFLRCGPADKVYLSHRKMTGYEFVPGEASFFKKDKLRIQKGTLVRFSVLAEKYDDAENEFKAVVSVEGDHLGPIS